MKFFPSTRFLLSLVASIFASSALVHAQYTDGQNANILWGQQNFTTGTSATAGVGTFKTPTDFAVDPTTGKFFVVDSANNRVLRFSSASAFVFGPGAEAVLGQPDFVTVAAPTVGGPTTLKAPTGAVVDSTGTLWVADTGDNRVVGFTNASTSTNNAPATLVFGQLSLTSLALPPPGTTQSGMNQPTGVAVSASGALYVVDQGNNRILIFNNPYVIGDGISAINADAQVGQTNYLVGTPSTTSTTFKTPTFAKFDGGGNLWVSDTGNNRVLAFSAGVLGSVGPAASVVVGQTDFVTGTGSTTQTTLKGPTGLTFDTLGRLYVGDTANNRIMIFENPSSLSDGLSASLVLGQTTFTTGTAATTQAGLSAPSGILYSNLELWTTDKNNNRVINFTITPGTPFINTIPGVKLNTKKKSQTLTFYIANNSINTDIFQASVSIPSTTTKLVKLSFSYAGQDVTSALESGTFTTPLFSAGQLAITVNVVPKNAAKKSGGTVQFTVNAHSTTLASVQASGVVSAKYKKPKQ